MIEIENSSQNYEQALAISLPAVKTYLDKIENQSKSISPSLDNDDYFTRFIEEMVGSNYLNELEDNYIYADNTIDDLTKECLKYFQEELIIMFENTLGISLSDPTLFILKAIYNIFVYRQIDYFIYFINGLQNTDESFKEDIPDYEQYKFKYFSKYVKKDEKNVNKYQNISDYIQYVMTLNLNFSNYISIALLESAGDVDLSALFIEDANYRISADDMFIFSKIRDIVISPIINDYIVSKLIEML